MLVLNSCAVMARPFWYTGLLATAHERRRGRSSARSHKRGWDVTGTIWASASRFGAKAATRTPAANSRRQNTLTVLFTGGIASVPYYATCPASRSRCPSEQPLAWMAGNVRWTILLQMTAGASRVILNAGAARHQQATTRPRSPLAKARPANHCGRSWTGRPDRPRASGRRGGARAVVATGGGKHSQLRGQGWLAQTPLGVIPLGAKPFRKGRRHPAVDAGGRAGDHWPRMSPPSMSAT